MKAAKQSIHKAYFKFRRQAIAAWPKLETVYPTDPETFRREAQSQQIVTAIVEHVQDQVDTDFSSMLATLLTPVMSSEVMDLVDPDQPE